MKTIFAALLAFTLFAQLHASAQIVLNGDFSANAADFTTYPGYISVNTPIDDWTASDNASVGINNLTGTGGISNAFAPPSPYTDGTTGTITDYAFIQKASELSQTIPTLAAGTYTLTFAAGQRFEFNPHGVGATDGTVIVADSLGDAFAGGTVNVTGAVGGTVFTQYTTTFVVPTTVTNAKISLANLNPEGGDTTLDFTNISITASSVPEPSTWALMLGGLGLLVSLQRRARRARRA